MYTQKTQIERKSPSPRKRKGMVAVLALAALAGGIAWIGLANPSTGETAEVKDQALPVEGLRLRELATIEVPARYAGTVEASRSAQLAFEGPGRLVSVQVKEGSLVSEGQVLAQLDLAELEVQRTQAESQLLQAEAVQRELGQGPRGEVIASTRAQVNEAQEQLHLLELQLQRREDLLRKEAISREELDTFKTQVRAQAARLESIRQRLIELQAGTRIEQLDAQRAMVALARARVEQLNLLIQKSSLRAPFAGRIARRMLDEGAYVNPGTPVLELIESGHLEIRVGLPPDQLASAVPERAYPVVVQGRRFNARMERVLPELDAVTRIVPVLLQVPQDAREAAMPGMLAHLELPRTLHGPGYRVPLAALTRADRGLWACFAILANPQGGSTQRVERREVEILHSDGDYAYVRGLVREGEQIVAGGVSKVTDGQLVLVVKES